MSDPAYDLPPGWSDAPSSPSAPPAQPDMPPEWLAQPSEPEIAQADILDVLDRSRDYVQRIMSISKNPQEDMDKLVSAGWMSHRTELPLQYVMEHYDAVAENYWGSVIAPKSSRTAISDAYQTALLQQKINVAAFKQLTGDKSPELEQLIQAWEAQIPDPDNLSRQWYVEIAKGAAGMLPYQIEMKKASVPVGLATGGLAALLGAAAGPASEFSMPAMFISNFIRGMSLGDKVYTFESEAGGTYRGLLKLGIPDDIATAISIPIGAGRTAFMTGALHNIPGLSKVFRGMDLENIFTRNLSQELVDKGALGGFLEKLAQKAASPAGKGLATFATEYGVKGQLVVPAMMTGAEFLTVLGEAAAKAWTKTTRGVDIPQENSKQIFDRLWETWKSTAIADLGMALPGALKESASRTVRGIGEGVARKRAAAEAQTLTAPVPEAVKVTEEAPAAAEGLQTSAKISPEEGVTLTTEAPKVVDARIHNEDDSQTYGHMSYIVDDRSADILWLQVAPGQEAHARDAIVSFMQKNAGKELRWNPTDAAGTALREQLVQENPRRAELTGAITELERTRGEQQTRLEAAPDEAARTAIAADMGRLESEIQRLKRGLGRVGLQWFDEASLGEESTVGDLRRAQVTSPGDPWRQTREEYSQEAEAQPAEARDQAFLQDPARGFLARAFTGWSRAEIDVGASLIEARANALGMNTQDFMERYFAPGLFKRWEGTYLPEEVFSKLEPDAFTLTQAKKAATEFLVDGRVLLHLSESADFSSWVHEAAHIFRRQLVDADAATAAQWAGAEKGWTREAEEKFATGFEDYLREGAAPTPQLEGIFARFSEWLKRIYQVLTARVEISPDIRRVYDRLFAPEESATTKEEAPSILFQPGESAETPSSRLTRLTESQPVVIQTSVEWQQADPPTLRKLAHDEYKKLRDQPAINADTGRIVRFVRTGFGKLGYHSAQRAIMEIVPRLREIAEKAILLWDEPDRHQRPEINAWHDFGTRVVLDGREVFVHFVAWEEKKELFVDLFHDASVTEGENVRGLLQPAILLPKQATAETGPAEQPQSAGLISKQGLAETASARDKLLRWVAAVKGGELSDTSPGQARALDTAAFRDWFAGSKAVDDQGRPRVFYHGTYSGFSTFEQTRDLGFHFGTSEQAATKIGGEAAREGARVVPVYLAIKNPLRLSRDVFSRFEELPMERAAEILATDAGLSNDEAASLYELGAKVTRLRSELGPTDRRYQDALEAFWDQAKRDLQGRGYDGIVYPNTVEGRDRIKYLLREEGISQKNATELLEGRKSVHEIVTETLAIHDSSNKRVTSDKLRITEDLEEYESHRSAIGAAYEQAGERISNILEGRLPDGSGSSSNESWIAFESNQVKSVFNRGTWSESPNILFHEAPEEGTTGGTASTPEATSAEHEASTREAVEAGEAVPEEVLREYKDRDWAKSELQSRERYLKDARTFDTFDEFRDYTEAMASPADPVHATEYLSMIWDQAKGEKVLDRQAANKRFLESFEGVAGKEALSRALEEAAYKNKLEGLHKVMQGVAKRLRGGVAIGKGLSDEAYVKIMQQLRDDPTRYRALFAEISGDEEAIRQVIEEGRRPQKESLEERLRRENRELRQQAGKSKGVAEMAARQVRMEKSYSADLERKIRKLQEAHEEKVAEMKLEASEKRKEQLARASEKGRERIAAFRDRQAAGRAQQRSNRKVREQFNKKIRELQKISREIPHMHPDAKGPLTDILGEILLKRTNSKRKLRLQEIREFFEKNPEVEVADSLKDTLAELDKKSVREMTVAEFDNLYNAVKHYAHLNRDIQTTRIGAEKMRQEDVLKNALGDFRRAKPLESDEFSEDANYRETETVGDQGKVGRAIRKGYDTVIGMGQDHYNLIVERIAGPLSIVHRLFVRAIEEGRRTQLEYKEKVHRQFQREIASIGVGNITAWLSEITPVDRFELTRGELMALWMHARNPDNLSSILHAGFGLRRREGDRRFHFNDEKELQSVLDTVGKEEQLFCEAAQRLFEAQGKDLARIFLEKNGYELPIVEGYYPKDVMPIGRGSDASKQDALDRFKGSFMRPGLAKGMLKERKGVDVPLYLNNIAFDIERSVNHAAAYVGFEIPFTHASRLLYNRDFREQLDRRFGPRVWTEIEKGLRDIAGEYQEIDRVERNLLKVRSGLTMAFLGFNPWSMLKQPLSLGNGLAYVKAKYLVQGTAEMIGRGREIMAMHRANSPYFNERLEVGFTRDIADAARVHSEKRLYGARTTAQRWGFLGIKSFDAVTVAAVMRGAWLQAMDELASGRLSRDVATALDLQGRSITNLGVEERNALAYKYADFVLTRTQDQALPEYRSSLSRSKWGKFFTLFGSSSNTALNLIRRSILDAGNNPDGAAIRRLALTILAVGVWGPAGEASVNLLRNTLRGDLAKQPQDDEEKLKTFIGDYIQNVGGLVYFVRDATNRAVNTWQYGAFGTSGDTTNPVGYLMDTVQSMIAVGVSAMTEDDYLDRKRKWTRFIDQFALTTSLLSQTPLYMPTKALTRAFGEPGQKKRR